MYVVKERLFKESIVESFYNCYLGGPVIVTTLAGPDFERIILLAYNKLNPLEINSYELEESIYNSQVAQHSFLPEEIAEITNVYHNNVSRAIVSNFMDIDLMSSVISQGKIVSSLLEQQESLKGLKCFIGTFSVRVTGVEKTFKYIRNIIGLVLKSRVEINEKEILFESKGKFNYLKQYSSIISGRITELNIFHYSDKGSPMVTFRLIYK